MKSAVKDYKEIASPWICVVVYLWVLELRAAIGTDSEPVAVWLADCAAILLTLVLWGVVFCLPIMLASTLIGLAQIRRVNGAAATVCLVLVTAMHFVRWLLNWQILPTEMDLGLVFLTVAAVGLTVAVMKRRKNHRRSTASALPSFEECFSFGALPVLLGAMVLIGVSVIGDQMSLPPNTSAAAVVTVPEEAVQSRPNIVLVVADALRAPSMSLYGRTRATTPNLDRWARSATVYWNNHANSTSTKPSMTTILTGKLPLSHGRLTKAQPPLRSGENLMQVLRDHGYYVGAVTSNEDASLNLLGFASSLSAKEYTAFEHLTLSWLRQRGVYPTPTGGRVYQSLAQFLPFLGYPRRTAYYGFAEDTLEAARDLMALAKKPFFLLIHLHEPHDPYDAPAPFRGMYSTDSRSSVRPKLSSSHYARYDGGSQSDADFYRDRYEESVRHLDKVLRRFLGEIDKLVKSERYAVVITSDHGESFERGFMNHGEDLFESSTHVPLVIRFPSQERGATLSGLTQSADIAPTLLSVAGIDAPKWMDGRALFPDQAPDSESTVALNFKDPIGQKTFDTPTKLALWSESYKLIQDCETGQALLYNLADDPGENTDLANTAPATLVKLRKLLKNKLAGQTRGPKITCALTDGH